MHEALQGIAAIPAFMSTVLLTKVHAEFVTAAHQLGEHDVEESQLVVIGAVRAVACIMTSVNTAPCRMYMFDVCVRMMIDVQSKCGKFSSKTRLSFSESPDRHVCKQAVKIAAAIAGDRLRLS